jgi:drug/metabolite transporter (DMT)-like permease
MLALGFGILAVSTASIFIRYAQQEAPSLFIAALRLSVAGLVLAVPTWLKRRQELARLKGRSLILALVSGLFLALHFATWISSLEFTSVASSVVLVTTTPLFVAVLSPLLLREPLRKMAVTGLILAFGGVILVALGDACQLSAGNIACASPGNIFTSEAIKGNLLALAGAVSAAFYVMIGRKLRKVLSLLSYIFIVYGMAAVILLGAMFAAGYPLLGYSPQTYMWVILLALIPQLIGHTTFNWALGYLSAAFVSIVLLGEPIGSTILAFLVLQETPGIMELSGGALILAGILIASLSENKAV